MIEEASVRQRVQKVLPLNTELKSFVERVDLVLAVNYCGSALIHVLRYHKPVILFYTDPIVGKPRLNTSGELFLDAGMLVRNPEELWDVVRKFFENWEFAESLRIKAAEFYQEKLDNSRYFPIAEAFENIFNICISP